MVSVFEAVQTKAVMDGAFRSMMIRQQSGLNKMRYHHCLSLYGMPGRSGVVE